jgi:ParB family chromosome partitioning protein
MASKKSALGKGLSALLPSEEREERSEEEQQEGGDLSKSKLYRFQDKARLLRRVADIELDSIRPNPYQPRQEFNDDALDELAASIEQLGIIQPITVRALGDGQFEIISGERRFRAARRAGLERLPAFVREANSEQMLEMALVENVQREELNPIEVALGYKRLLEECGLTQEEVAEKVSKSRATVANFLRLLRLPPRIQAALRDKSVSMGHARALITIEDEDAQVDLLETTIDEDLSVREVERRVRARREADEDADGPADGEATASSAARSNPPDRDAMQLEQYRDKLRSFLSTQVKIKHKSDGEGHIEISYYSEDDLERLLELVLD